MICPSVSRRTLNTGAFPIILCVVHNFDWLPLLSKQFKPGRYIVYICLVQTIFHAWALMQRYVTFQASAVSTEIFSSVFRAKVGNEIYRCVSRLECSLSFIWILERFSSSCVWRDNQLYGGFLASCGREINFSFILNHLPTVTSSIEEDCSSGGSCLKSKKNYSYRLKIIS